MLRSLAFSALPPPHSLEKREVVESVIRDPPYLHDEASVKSQQCGDRGLLGG